MTDARPAPAAEAYERHAGRYAAELADAFVCFAGVMPEIRTLDVGCGPAALALRLAAIVGAMRVAAVDPSTPYVEACRQRLPGADIRVATAEDLPFDDASFQAVLAQLVMQILTDPGRGDGAHARRCPRRGPGDCVWDSRSGMPLLEAFFESARSVDPAGAWRAGRDQENPWCTREGLRELWTSGGLQAVETSDMRATASYEDADDAWWSFAAGVGMTGTYCRSLRADHRAALRLSRLVRTPQRLDRWQRRHPGGGPRRHADRRGHKHEKQRRLFLAWLAHGLALPVHHL